MPSEYGEFINIDQLHYATVQDALAAYTASANKYLAPAGEISHEPSVNMKTRYYDGVAMFTTNTEGETKVTINISGVPTKLAAELTGKYYNAAKGILIDTGEAGDAPWCALSGRMELGDGGYKYFQYLKGKFAVGKTSAKSKSDDIDPQTTELTYTAVTTVHQFLVDNKKKGVKGIHADTTDEAFTGAATWFDTVQKPDEPQAA
jgi:phi13 family phage major tail protein